MTAHRHHTIDSLRLQGAQSLAAIAFIAAVSAAPGALATEILVNPGFETGSLGPWFAAQGSPVISSAEAHSGSFSVSAFSGDLIEQNFTPIATSLVTDVSFWAQRSGGPFDMVELLYADGTSTAFAVSNFSTSNWTFFDVTSHLATGEDLSGIGVWGTSPGPAYLDDFTVNANTTTVPEPGTLALLSLGVVGLGLHRRRG
jgi:PEP-CTERM motif